MGIVVLYLLLVTTVVRSFKHQETAVYAYYLMSVMAPQYIWFWVFEGVKAFNIRSSFIDKAVYFENLITFMQKRML